MTVDRIFADYLSGLTYGQIATTLNGSGLRTRAGGPWHISAVQRILTNAAYKGTLIYRDITAEGAFPVIIDANRWEQVQALRRQKAGTHRRRMGGTRPTYCRAGSTAATACAP